MMEILIAVLFWTQLVIGILGISYLTWAILINRVQVATKYEPHKHIRVLYIFGAIMTAGWICAAVAMFIMWSQMVNMVPK